MIDGIDFELMGKVAFTNNLQFPHQDPNFVAFEPRFSSSVLQYATADWKKGRQQAMSESLQQTGR